MKQGSLFSVVATCLVGLAGFSFAPSLRAASVDPIEAKVSELLSKMTLEEKCGQLVQYSSADDMTGPATGAAIAKPLSEGRVGSLFNIVGAAEIRKWQKQAVDSSRLHIPLLFGLDVIHGYRTVFPIPLATAASWDMSLIERGERIAATEAASAGIKWTFAPMVDIARDPRWGRISEGSGEDPFLGSAIARARVHGFQGTDLKALDTVMACGKHFAAYGAAQAGRDYWTTEVTERVLRETYLPPFKAALEAGIGTYMAAFNDLDGRPCTSNYWLLTKLLRKEWGFKGFVVSDWAGIEETIPHTTAADLRDAARQAINAGLDMDMQSDAYGKHLVELVRSGAVPESRVDEAASAILAAKFRLGLFDDPYRFCDEQREKDTLLRKDFLEAARDSARRSCVLLKNDGILPLSSKVKTVALVGPLADSPLHQLGAWHGLGHDKDSFTVRRALGEIYTGSSLQYAFGCDVRGDDEKGIAEAVAAATKSDLIIAALGEDSNQSGEASSRGDLNLSGPQEKLLRALHATGKPIVLLLMTGRPLTIEPLVPLVGAILVPWHPGTMGGPAIADVLTGAYNPSGHLPLSWPRSMGQIPYFYNHKPSGRPTPLANDPNDPFYSHYIDIPNTPLFPFGFGLSYTSFDIAELRLSSPKLAMSGAPLKATVRVTNTGKVFGEQVVQLYVRDRVGSITRPVRELKGFHKLGLNPGESRDVEFTLTPADLAFWQLDMSFRPEPGAFDLYVGSDCTAKLTTRFDLE